MSQFQRAWSTLSGGGGVAQACQACSSLGILSPDRVDADDGARPLEAVLGARGVAVRLAGSELDDQAVVGKQPSILEPVQHGAAELVSVARPGD